MNLRPAQECYLVLQSAKSHNFQAHRTSFPHFYANLSDGHPKDDYLEIDVGNQLEVNYLKGKNQTTLELVIRFHRSFLMQNT